RSLISTWLNVQDPQSGFDYLNRSLEKYTNDDMAVGTLAFYRALMYAQTAQSVDDLKLAMADIEEAEKRFGTVYDKDNQVFLVISQLKDEWNQFLQQQSAPDASAVPGDQSQQPAETPEASSSQTDDQTQQPAETPEASPEASSDATSGATE
ncbi:MAG: hypothetical protein ABFC92_08530, partial [Rectinema sp.]